MPAVVKLRVGIVAPAFFYVPYWAAAAHGWYRKHGLDVEILDLGGIVQVTRALKEGTIDIGIGSPEHVVHDAESGGDLRMFGGNVSRLTHSLIVQPEIRALGDLRGKVIGVSALNAGTSSLFIDVLDRHGMHAGDYTLVVAGAVPPRHDKLIRREIDAAMQTDPHNYMAEDLGFNNLGALSSWIPDFQFTSINARLTWVQTHREAMLGFLRGSLQGSAFFFADKTGAIAIAAAHQGLPQRYLERAWADHVTGAVPIDLHLKRTAIDTAVEMMRRDRSSTVRIEAGARAERYVSLDLLADAQRLERVPVRTMV